MENTAASSEDEVLLASSTEETREPEVVLPSISATTLSNSQETSTPTSSTDSEATTSKTSEATTTATSTDSASLTASTTSTTTPEISGSDSSQNSEISATSTELQVTTPETPDLGRNETSTPPLTNELIKTEESQEVHISTETSEFTLPQELGSSIIANFKNRKSEIALQMKMINAESHAKLKKEDIRYIYSDISQNIDLEYKSIPNGIKESIILKQKNHPNNFKYELNLEQFDFKQVGPNKIELYKKGESNNPLSRLYTISAPKMTDAAGNESKKILLTIEDSTLSITPDPTWLEQASYPVLLDPTIEIEVLNVHSHPVQGDEWKVEFTTQGTSTLKISPADQSTVEDDEFSALFCGEEDRTSSAQILSGDAILYPDWSCETTAYVTHNTLKSGNHHLIFEFGGDMAEAFNSTITWDGGGGDANWNTAANWSGDVAPGTGDLANFDNTCVTNCSPTINATVSVAGINMASTYAGTITQGAGNLLTVGTSNLTIAGGTFTAAATPATSTIINGSFVQSGGTFNATSGNMDIHLNMTLSGGTFNNNSGTVTFMGDGFGESTVLTCTGSPFNKVVINKTNNTFNLGTMTVGAGCTVPLGASPLTYITSGMTNNGTITISSGTWNVLGFNITNNGTISHGGTGWTGTSGLINALSTSTVTYSGTAITFNHDLNIATGTFPTGLDITFNGPDFAESTTITCSGSPFNKVIFNKTGATFDSTFVSIGDGCTVPLGASPTTRFASGITNFGTITVSSGTWTDISSHNLNNYGTIAHSGSGWSSDGGLIMQTSTSSVTYSGSAISFNRNLNILQGSFPTGKTITFNGTNFGDSTTVSCSGSPFGQVVINKSSLTFDSGPMIIIPGCIIPLGANPTSLIGDGMFNYGSTTISSGTWTLNGESNLFNYGDIVHSGNGWAGTGGLINATATSTVTYGGTSATFARDLNVVYGTFPSGLNLTFNGPNFGDSTTLTLGSTTINNLTINKTDANTPFTFASSTSVGGNLSITGGQAMVYPVASTTITVGGNLSIGLTGIFGSSTLPVVLSGTTTSVVASTSGTFSSPLTISKTESGLAQLSTAFMVTGQPCTVSTGTFDLNGNNFVCGSTFSVASSTILMLLGSESNVTTPTLATGSTVSYKGDGDSAADTFTNFKDWSYKNLTINTTDSADTIDGSGLASVSVAGNLGLTNGNFKTPTTFNVAGNVSGVSGIVTAGTVTLNGTNQFLYGTSTFYNLSKTVSSPDTLTFESGNQTTITNTMTLSGAASNLLSLRSTASGTQARIDPRGTRTVSYLDVKDNRNIHPSPILTSGFNITNSGNNFGWAFYSLAQADYQVFSNQDSLTPGGPLGLLNSTTTLVSTSSAFRLRLNLLVSGDLLQALEALFKLQIFSTSTNSWTDISNPSGGAPWYNSTWLYRKKITFNNSSSATDLNNFPVLVSLNQSFGNIDYTKTKAAGADIRFTDSDGVTLLPYEIEKWDASGTSTIWVKVPTISAASTTDNIYMYYNNAAASDAQNAAGVWDSNYMIVQHLNETSGTNINDSTSFNRDGTKVSSILPLATSTGFIDGAQYFGSGGYINLPAGITFNKPVTVDLWYNGQAGSGNWRDLMVPSADRGPHINPSNKLTWYNNGESTAALSLSQWYHLVISIDSSGNISYYINGSASGTSSGATGSDTWSAVGGADENTNGNMDEVRLSNTNRSADYILAEYKTDSNQFNTYGSEEASYTFYDNPTITSSSTLPSLLLNSSDVAGTYQEGNPTAYNPSAVSSGQQIEYDFSFNPFSFINGNYYNFRLVRPNGDLLDSYTNLPTLTSLTTNSAPNAPSNLGPASVVSGGYINSHTPNFTFDLSDPNGADTVKYQIIIDDTANFSSPIIDYTSALAAQGSASFSVGQAAGSGSYTVGSSATTLSDSSSGYYWRVYAIDNNSAFSASTTANSGAVAFKVDTVAPTAGTITLSPTSATSITATISGASDATSGLAATPYNFFNLTAGTSTEATTTTSWLSSGLLPNTSYSFNASTSDAAGNSATTSTASIFTLANIPTTLATTSVASTSVGLSWNENSNPALTTYVVQNVTANTFATTTATTTTISSLTCATSYNFRVKAVNGDGAATSFTSTISETTSACSTGGGGGGGSGGGGGGGGSPPGLPTGGFKILIDNDATTTATSSVILTLDGGKDAKEMEISNRPDFVNATRVPYNQAFPWNICSLLTSCVNGTYQVYSKFYSGSGVASNPVTDSIILDNFSSPPIPKFTVSLQASKDMKTWASPLQNVALNQKVSLQAVLSLSSVDSNVDFQFDCSSDGKYDKLVDHTKKTSYVARNTCSFPKAGIYTARILATYQGYTAISTVIIAVNTVIPPPPPPVTYAACINFACTILSGLGVDSCHSNFDCSPVPPPNHSVCQNNSCTVVSGAGVNACALNNDCVVIPPTHSACLNNACTLVSGAGANTCSTNFDCTPVPPPNHSVCQNNACAIVSGAGSNQCSVNNDCNPPVPTHSACQNNACVQVNGAGADSCSTNFDCTPVPPPNHSVCQNNSCTIVSGAGTNQCSLNSDCEPPVTESHSVCVNNSCTLVSGPGTDACSTNFDCGAPPNPNHSVCANNACVVVSGAGENSCLVDSDCRTSNPIDIIDEKVINPIIDPIKEIFKDIWSGIVGGIGGTGSSTKNFFGAIGNANDEAKLKLQQLGPIAGTGIVALSLVTVLARVLMVLKDFPLNILSFSDAYYSFVSLSQGFLTSIGLRKRRRYWGTVYDSLNKQPLDPAIVELVDVFNGRTIEQSITDLFGRFGFLDKPGSYYIRPKKTHYAFPSTMVKGTSDGVFDNIYHGEKLEIRSDEGVLAPNIPMDPEGFDWNQQEKRRLGLGKLNTKYEAVVLRLFQFIFWAGLAAMIYMLVTNPTGWNIFFAVLYAFMSILNRLVPSPKLWGRVESDSIRIDGLLIELSYIKLNVLVGKAVTNARGRFFLKSPEQGQYILKVKQIRPEGNVELASQIVNIGSEKVVNSIVKIN